MLIFRIFIFFLGALRAPHCKTCAKSRGLKSWLWEIFSWNFSIDISIYLYSKTKDWVLAKFWNKWWSKESGTIQTVCMTHWFALLQTECRGQLAWLCTPWFVLVKFNMPLVFFQSVHFVSLKSKHRDTVTGNNKSPCQNQKNKCALECVSWKIWTQLRELCTLQETLRLVSCAHFFIWPL